VKLSIVQRFRNAAKAFGTKVSEAMSPVSSAWTSLSLAVGDWVSGAWATGTPDPDAGDVRSALNVAMVYDCVRRIATDIAKMSPGVRRLADTGVWVRATHQVFDRLLSRPNHFQTWFQFILCWVTCRLVAGNVYVIKLYSVAGLVEELVVLDPSKVTPMVTESGRVFYEVSYEPLALVREAIVVSSDDIIHDRYLPLGHPLIGTSPLDRALSGATARGGIIDNAGDLSTHAGVPPGILTTPEGLTDEQADQLADRWRKIPRGRIAVIDAAYKFEALAAKYVDSQSKELAELSGLDICAAFGVPPWKMGVGVRPMGDPEALQVIYYQDTLQWQVEEIEQCLDFGLGVAAGIYIELDPACLLKLDSRTRAEVQKVLVGSGVMAPNEARMAWDLGPVEGGDTPYMQQQNYSLSALNRRDLAAPAPSSATGSSPGPAEKADAGPETDPEDAPAKATRPPVLPWAGVYDADGEYPPGVFVTHKGALWARAGGTQVSGQEPGKSADWRLAVKRGEAPTENN
jgi:HK97 family phage portal protein